jgi:hypothetical protein
MSRGPGRIQRAIIAAFKRYPKRSFTTDELVVLAYPGVRRIEKKHRVAVLRAAWHVAPKYSRVALTMSGFWGIGTGSPLLFVNQLDEVGWLRGCIRARLPWFWRQEVAKAKGIPSPDWADDYEEWRREHEIVRLQAAGETERAVELQLACDVEREKEITSMMTRLGVERALATRCSRYYPGIKMAKVRDGRAVSVIKLLGEGPPFDQVFSEIVSELRSQSPSQGPLLRLSNTLNRSLALLVLLTAHTWLAAEMEPDAPPASG